jgi:hypothetical protein
MRMPCDKSPIFRSSGKRSWQGLWPGTDIRAKMVLEDRAGYLSKLFIHPEVKKLVPIQSSAVVEAVFSGLQSRYRDSRLRVQP